MAGFTGPLARRVFCALLLGAAVAYAAPTTRPLRRFSAAPESPHNNRPIPGLAAQQQAEVKIKEIFATDYADPSFNGRRALAKRLIDASEQTQFDWDAKYVLLHEAQQLAAVVGDVTTAFDAIDRMADTFPISRLVSRTEVLQSAVPKLSAPNSNLAAVSLCIDLVDQCLIDGEYDRADALLALASDAAKRAKSRPYFEWTDQRAASIRPLKDAWEIARPAQAALMHAADDPAANLVVGKFSTFVKGDFDTGLPMLAKCADADLAGAAKQDLQTPVDSPQLQLKAGNAWWELADSQPVDYRTNIRRRAGFWYRHALTGLDGLDRALAQRRLQELNPPHKPGEKSRRPPDALQLMPGHWYRANIAEVSWETAHQLCQDAGGQLISIETRAEGDLIVKLARGRALWLGGSNDGAGKWNWLSGADLFYNNWAAGEPSHQAVEFHPVTSTNGAWKASAGKAGFICEWRE